MNFKNKEVLVVGLATSGIPTVETLIELEAKVSVNDMKSKEQLGDILEKLKDKDIELILGKHPDSMDKYDYMVLSPGVPTDLAFINKARELGVVILGELELAYQLCKGSFVGITGTNGKTTTTALTGEIFKNAQLETYVVGNIGVAAVSKALKASSDANMITEVSSFQLESIIDFKPKIGAILNISPDHLNRHKTMENYIKAKANIFKNQNKKDFLILNRDNELTYKFKNQTKAKVVFFSRKKELKEGCFVVDGNIVFVKNDGEKEIICRVDQIKIPGEHNLENALGAVSIAKCAGIDKEVIAYTLKNFKGVEHRLEFVEEINGVSFVNDSKGTNPDASIKAIEAIKAPIILIAGGMDKGSNFEKFIQSFNGKVKHMVLIGETANDLKQTAQKYGFVHSSQVKDMEEAVKEAFKVATSGDTILLSPACASWDMYPNFEVRGKHFKSSVEKLRRQ